MPLSERDIRPMFSPAARPTRVIRADAWKPLEVLSFDSQGRQALSSAEIEARNAEQQLTQQLEASWQSGHDAGFAAAQQQYHEEEQALGMNAAERVSSMLTSLNNGLQAIQGNMAQQVLALALEFGRRIACEQIRANPDALLPVLSESMQRVSQRIRHLEVSVHPDDQEICRHWFATEHPELALRVLPSPRISRGGCQIMAGSTFIDSRVETRVARAFAGMGTTEEQNTQHLPPMAEGSGTDSAEADTTDIGHDHIESVPVDSARIDDANATDASAEQSAPAVQHPSSTDDTSAAED